MSHATCHMSHVTRHTSHVARHTSHVTLSAARLTVCLTVEGSESGAVEYVAFERCDV
jgi:hypothetical protein